MQIGSTTWDKLHGELVKFVHVRVKDMSTAEDIVQDVFIKVHAKGSQLRQEEKISSWIYQITRNAVADHFRAMSRNVAPINIDWESSYHEFNDCVARCMSALMATLPEKYRVPLELAEIEGLSQFEVSEKLNISYSGARSRVQRARTMLKDKLDELYYIKTDRYGNVLNCENRVPCCCNRSC
jgi:RNA polymerase sigma-70 factor, ECF subfamily